MKLENKYIHDIYWKDLKYDSGYESFCFQNCLKILMEAKDIENTDFFINRSLSLLFDSESYEKMLYTHMDVRGLLPGVGVVNRYYNPNLLSKEVFDYNCTFVSNNKEPIIVGVDSFYLPYTSNYKKNHAVHTAIMCGYDLKNASVYLIDWYEPWLYKGEISLEEFLLARDSKNEYDGSIFSGTPIENNWAYIQTIEKKSIEYLFKNLIDLSVDQYFSDKKDKQGVQALEGVMNILVHCNNPEKYKKIYDNLYISLKRHKFFCGALVNYYIYKSSLLLNDIINIMKEIIIEWDNILLMIIKLSMRNNESTKNRMLVKFSENIGKEKEICNLINMFSRSEL